MEFEYFSNHIEKIRSTFTGKNKHWMKGSSLFEVPLRRFHAVKLRYIREYKIKKVFFVLIFHSFAVILSPN